MKCQFDPQIAKALDVDSAIMFSNIAFWCEKNEANEKHFYDDKYWTYNSAKAFGELFPFWNEDQIRRIINKLIKNQYIEKGNYNKNKYDKTGWYTHGAKSPHRTGEIATSIYIDNNKDNTDNKPYERKKVTTLPPKEKIPITEDEAIDVVAHYRTTVKPASKYCDNQKAVEKIMKIVSGGKATVSELKIAADIYALEVKQEIPDYRKRPQYFYSLPTDRKDQELYKKYLNYADTLVNDLGSEIKIIAQRFDCSPYQVAYEVFGYYPMDCRGLNPFTFDEIVEELYAKYKKIKRWGIGKISEKQSVKSKQSLIFNINRDIIGKLKLKCPDEFKTKFLELFPKAHIF